MSSFAVEQVRADYPTLASVCYLNTGTVGLMSETVLRSHLETIANYERGGHHAEKEARSGYENARNALATLIDTSTNQIALTRNASDGINYVLHGLEIPSGSTLITTDQEHPAVLLPLRLAAARNRAGIDILPVEGSDDELLEGLRLLLTGRNSPALALFSHVSCETGRRLPVSEMCRLCREHGVFSLVDGAQSVGQFPVDVGEVDCDFMTGNGHKWLCGPKGTGFLYVKEELISRLTPAYIGDGSIEPKFDRRSWDPANPLDGWEYRPDAQRFEFGTRNWHLYGALPAAVEQMASWGWENIQKHVSEISTTLKETLCALPGVTVHTPPDWTNSSGLVTFSVEGWEGTELSDRLWNEYRIIQRRVQIPSAVRVSCAHFTSSTDVEQFLTALRKLTNAS